MKMQESEYLECSSMLYESQLSSYDLLMNADSKKLEEQIGALQLKKGLDQKEFSIAELKPNVFPQCAVIQSVESIKITTNQGPKSLLDILGKNIPSEDKAFLFARAMQVNGSDGYVADIIIFND